MTIIRNQHFWKHWLPAHMFGILGLYLMFTTQAWSIAVIAFVFYLFISGLGVAVGHHRYFCHNAFKTNRFWQNMMLYFGDLACHGNHIFWIALHNGLHHRYSDQPKDIHSPIHGFWQSYQGYVFIIKPSDVPMRSAAPFLRHPEWQWAVKYYTPVIWITWIATIAIDWRLFCGLAIAQLWAIHQEALVNVLGHKSGFGAYRSYEIDDLSVNRNLLGLITWGQALHNNHHADARSPYFDIGGSLADRKEFDPCRIWIKLIETR